MSSILGLYSAAFARRPMATQSATSAVIFGAGDVIAQQLVDRRGLRNHDLIRTARFVFYGACLFGPVLTKWHQFINHRHFDSPFRAVVYKVTLDQLVAAPFITVPMFFGSMSILEGRPDEAIPRIKNSYVPTLTRGWCLFIPAQIVNFAFVPVSMRILFFSTVALCWNTYLSFFNAEQRRLQEQSENLP
ncbi:integral membrane mpv17 pmp22 [Lentinula edodes]|uniref:Integral membrane mpv17 pmp22 n=1 Tax=Lentinula edodes TaxID=5353 RepID=A0A1Q3EJ68_LENED|nr:integral membrane mpv17 pmp22 [Lentinula edodes]